MKRTILLQLCENNALLLEVDEVAVCWAIRSVEECMRDGTVLEVEQPGGRYYINSRHLMHAYLVNAPSPVSSDA